MSRPGVRALTVIDLFAGAGGATQGLEDAGFRAIAAIELDADAAATYVTNHPAVDVIQRDKEGDSPEYGDDSYRFENPARSHLRRNLRAESREALQPFRSTFRGEVVSVPRRPPSAKAVP